nr:uncharacterized protein LOC125978114 [Syngnathus scovelli]
MHRSTHPLLLQPALAHSQIHSPPPSSAPTDQPVLLQQTRGDVEVLPLISFGLHKLNTSTTQITNNPDPEGGKTTRCSFEERKQLAAHLRREIRKKWLGKRSRNLLPSFLAMEKGPQDKISCGMQCDPTCTINLCSSPENSDIEDDQSDITFIATPTPERTCSSLANLSDEDDQSDITFIAATTPERACPSLANSSDEDDQAAISVIVSPTPERTCPNLPSSSDEDDQASINVIVSPTPERARPSLATSSNEVKRPGKLATAGAVTATHKSRFNRLFKSPPQTAFVTSGSKCTRYIMQKTHINIPECAGGLAAADDYDDSNEKTDQPTFQKPEMWSPNLAIPPYENACLMDDVTLEIDDVGEPKAEDTVVPGEFPPTPYNSPLRISGNMETSSQMAETSSKWAETSPSTQASTSNMSAWYGQSEPSSTWVETTPPV